MARAQSSERDARGAQDSLARVEAGGIPLEAERRLSELRESAGSFTSDLSTADYALCHQLGLRPLSQVMGSSIYQVGYQQSVGWMGAGGVTVAGGLVAELETLTEAWNEGRTRALQRLAREAQLVAADAVVGVDLKAEARTFGDSSMSSGVIEYSVIGTAVRRERAAATAAGGPPPARPSRGIPVLTELSVADYAKLLSAGIEPVGIAAWSSVFSSTYGYQTALRAQPGLLMPGQESFELREFTQAVYAAREQVMRRLGFQAQALGASGIVGVRIAHEISRQGQGGLMVTFHAIGTAIEEATHATPAAPKPIIDLLA
jgi:uncharacterized protein YbjQ (UPF0145 family)